MWHLNFRRQIDRFLQAHKVTQNNNSVVMLYLALLILALASCG